MRRRGKGSAARSTGTLEALEDSEVGEEIVRRRYRWDKDTGEMVEVPWDARQTSLAPEIWDDLPGYNSPVTGQWVEGRKQRREDLRRTNSRPYEGREQEQREAAKVAAEKERKLDQLAEKMAYRAWDAAPERVRRVFRGK